MTHRFSHSIIDREKRIMWLENYLIVAFLTIISGLQYHRDDIFEESGVHEEFHRPVRPQPPGRRIPEWSQFFYLRSSDQQEKPRGFSYHVTNRNRPQVTFNRRHSSPFEETRQQDLQSRDYFKEKRRESPPAEQYYEPNYSREEYSPEDSREDEPTSREDSIEREDLPRQNETSTLISRSGNIPEDPKNIPDLRPVYRDEVSSSYRSQSDLYEKKESSKLIRDENNDNYPLYESDRQITPEITKVPRIPPVVPGHPDPLYGVVDTYLQFPPISFRFHISPHVQVLRPSELAIRQPPRIGFGPLVTVGNSSLPYPIVHGNKVRIQVVARGNGENPMTFTPKTTEETNPKSETEELSSSTTSATVTRPTIPKLLAKILETTTLLTTKNDDEPTKTPIFTKTETETTTLQSTTLSTEKEDTTTEITTKTETTTTTTVKPETTTKTTTESETTTTELETTTTSTLEPETTTTTSTDKSETTTATTTAKPETTENQNINHDTTLMDVLVEIKSTETPIDTTKSQETTTESNIEETKSENIKVPCGSDANNKTNPFTISPKISTATSVIETRVDFVTTATVSERLSSSKESNTKENQNKDNLVFMAAENLEFW